MLIKFMFNNLFKNQAISNHYLKAYNVKALCFGLLALLFTFCSRKEPYVCDTMDKLSQKEKIGLIKTCDSIVMLNNSQIIIFETFLKSFSVEDWNGVILKADSLRKITKRRDALNKKLQATCPQLVKNLPDLPLLNISKQIAHAYYALVLTEFPKNCKALDKKSYPDEMSQIDSTINLYVKNIAYLDSSIKYNPNDSEVLSTRKDFVTILLKQRRNIVRILLPEIQKELGFYSILNHKKIITYLEFASKQCSALLSLDSSNNETIQMISSINKLKLELSHQETIDSIKTQKFLDSMSRQMVSKNVSNNIDINRFLKINSPFYSSLLGLIQTLKIEGHFETVEYYSRKSYEYFNQNNLMKAIDYLDSTTRDLRILKTECKKKGSTTDIDNLLKQVEYLRFLCEIDELVLNKSNPQNGAIDSAVIYLEKALDLCQTYRRKADPHFQKQIDQKESLIKPMLAFVIMMQNKRFEEIKFFPIPHSKLVQLVKQVDKLSYAYSLNKSDMQIMEANRISKNYLLATLELNAEYLAMYALIAEKDNKIKLARTFRNQMQESFILASNTFRNDEGFKRKIENIWNNKKTIKDSTLSHRK